MTSRYSPCIDTPPAATAPVTAVVIALLLFYKKNFLSLHSLVAQGWSDSPPAFKTTLAAWGVFVHELYPFIKYQSQLCACKSSYALLSCW